MKPLLCWMHQYVANGNAFRDHLKLFLPTTGSRKLSGREFQTDGLATRKARRPWELSWWCGTTRSCWVADWRCCDDVTSATGWHNSTRYEGAWPCWQLNTVTQNSMYNCTWLAEEHPANVARYGGVATSLDWGYSWPHDVRHQCLPICVLGM